MRATARQWTTMNAKPDFKRTLDAYRARQGELGLAEVPDLRYLMVDGQGDPNTRAFAEAVETIYPVAYALKFASRQVLDLDYVVPPLEGMWWADNMDSFTVSRDKSRWSWTLMTLVPDWLDQDLFAAAVAQVAARRRPVRLDDVPLSEGRCVQTLHIGSFDDEADVLERMHHEFIPAHGLRLTGPPPRNLPQRLPEGPARQTPHILRQPVVDA